MWPEVLQACLNSSLLMATANSPLATISHIFCWKRFGLVDLAKNSYAYNILHSDARCRIFDMAKLVSQRHSILFNLNCLSLCNLC